MIRKVTIEHYKSIDRVSLDVPPLTIFVGPNGVGKSNLVDALRMIRDSVSSGLDRAISERHGIDSIRQWSPSRPYHVSLHAEVENRLGAGALSFTLSSYKGNHSVHREEARWEYHDDRRPPALSYVRDSDGHVKMRRGGEPRQIKARADQPEELFLSGFEARGFRPLMNALASFEAYSIYPNVLREPQKPSSDTRLSSSGDNLTSVFRAMTKSKRRRHQEARAEIISSMKFVMPSLENVRIQSVGGLMVPVFRVRESDGRAHDFNVSQVSDGSLRVLGLLTALYQPDRPEVIAMEEPEQTVNPGVLALLADSILETSQHTQVMVTTHSPELLDRFDDPEVVRAVDMEDGITKVGPISSHQRDAVRARLFSLGELMSVEGLHQ